jgi:glycosyltransferase involved in cell wall biosynthesis
MEEQPKSPPVEFSMAILCYRAGDGIIPFIENLHRIMSMFRIEWELVLVANYWPGTDDPTPDVCRMLATKLPHVRCVAEPKQGAMGWDMRKGLEACRGRYLGVIDGDGQFPVEAIFSCFAKIRSEDYDFIKTYRVIRADGIYRDLVSALYNRLFLILFPAYRGFHDVNSKPKIMKREAYERMELTSDDWFIDAEIMLNCLGLGLRMYEIPVRFQSLGGRKSFVRPGAVTEFLRHLLAYRFGPRYRRHRTHA